MEHRLDVTDGGSAVVEEESPAGMVSVSLRGKPFLAQRSGEQERAVGGIFVGVK